MAYIYTADIFMTNRNQGKGEENSKHINMYSGKINYIENSFKLSFKCLIFGKRKSKMELLKKFSKLKRKFPLKQGEGKCKSVLFWLQNKCKKFEILFEKK